MKLDKYKGCLIGGAIGDALGYAVEFNYIDEIVEKHGEPGIIDYELTNGVAQISDDTQMTLILGAALGMAKIPSKFIENLELKDVIIKMAELFQRDKSTVSRHIKNVISPG